MNEMIFSLLRYQAKKFCLMIQWLQANTRWLPNNMSNTIRIVLNIETSLRVEVVRKVFLGCEVSDLGIS